MFESREFAQSTWQEFHIVIPYRVQQNEWRGDLRARAAVIRTFVRRRPVRSPDHVRTARARQALQRRLPPAGLINRSIDPGHQRTNHFY
jgi:hypothetical protein